MIHYCKKRHFLHLKSIQSPKCEYRNENGKLSLNFIYDQRYILLLIKTKHNPVTIMLANQISRFMNI